MTNLSKSSIVLFQHNMCQNLFYILLIRTSFYLIKLQLYLFSADNLPYEKVGKKEPVCIEDEVPFEIPESWEWVTLKMIAVTELGKTLDKAKNQGDYKPYLCSINVYWTGIDLSTVKEARFEESELPKYELKKGDLLICEGGDVGRSAIWEEEQEMYYQNALHRVRFYGGINPYYFRLLMECYKGNKILDEQSKGMTIKHLVQSALNTIYFPLPPIQEQQRIVDKFQSLLPLLDRYNAAEIKLSGLNTGFPKLLKKSILQEAVQGKLVPQDPADEPASILLERIRAEKEELIKSGKIKRNKHESVIFRRNNSHYEKRGSEVMCIDDFLPFELPCNWQWERLINLYNFIDYRGSTPTKIEAGIPLITAKNVKKGYIDYKISDYISETEYCNRQSRGISRKGDILFTTEAPLGNVALADLEQFSAGQRLITLQQYTSETFINNSLIMYFMLSNSFQSQLIEQSTGTTVKGIKADKLKQLWIPIPPLQEQMRILEQLEKVLGACVAL